MSVETAETTAAREARTRETQIEAQINDVQAVSSFDNVEAAAPMPLPFVLRAYRPADYPAVHALWRAAGLRPHIEAQIALLLSSGGQVLVAEAKNTRGETEIAGAVLWSHNGCNAFLNRMAVGDEFRRRGIASALLRQVENEARSLGLEGLRLWMFHDNASAGALYGGAGWHSFPNVECWGKRLDPIAVAGAEGAEPARPASNLPVPDPSGNGE